MSAVIWFGIVAVWAFVLIPTWVRRSDIHWRRSGDATSTRDKLGRAARVIRSGGRRTTTARATVPSMRRPTSTTGRRTTVAAASSTGGGRTTTLVKGSVEELSRMDAQTETLSAVVVDEPPTQQIPAVGRRSARRVDEVEDAEVVEPADDAHPTATETVSSAQVADAAEPEAPMTTPRTPRPVPRRTAPGHGKAELPPHVQRARRLVWIGATAVATLLLAFVFRGWWILLNLVADLALFAYLRYLRGIAKQQLARKARSQTARAEARSEARSEARTPAARAPERAAPVRPQQRRSVPRHRADSPITQRPAAPRPTTARTGATAPAAAAPGRTPEVIDLTDDALSDDCPTTELTVARAV